MLQIRWLVLVAAATALFLFLWLRLPARDLLIGVGSGVVATATWALLERHMARARNRRSFGPLERTYRARRKGAKEPHAYEGTVKIKVDGNVLLTSGDGAPSAGSWVGEIVMSEAYRASGTGFFRHTESDGWGIHTVQLKGKEILVHTEFVKDERMVVRGYVWEPLPGDG